PMPPATSLKQLVDHYLEREGNNELVGRLSLPTFTASIEGQKLRTLPPRLLEVMRSPRNSATRLQPDEVKSAEPTPWVVSGMAMITLGIERRVYKEKGGPPAGQPSPPPPSPPGTGEAPRPTTDDDLGDMEDLLLTGGSRQAAGVTGPVAGFPSPVTVPQPAAAFEPVAGPEAAAGDSEAKTPPTPAGAAAAEEKKGADGKDAGGEKKAEVEAPVKAAGRAPVVWRQNTAEAFARGRLDGVAISSRGEVVLAPSLRKDAALDAAYAWSLLAANGAIYAGTGDGGVLYRAAGGKVEPVLKSGELQILALAKDAAGNVYAGTAPSGLVFRVTPGGAGSCFWRSPEEYILSLAVDAQGNVYAGTSPHGRIYRITPDGKGALFATVPDPYVISLAVVGDEVYAGTGADAVVFRIAADGRVRTFFDPGEGATATLVAPDRRGGLFVGTAPRGTVFRVAADGHARMLHEKSAAGITALAEGGPGVVWATAGAVVYRVEDAPREPLVEKIENKDAPTFLALAVDDAGGVALGSATGDIYRLAATQPQRGVFDSAVRDAGSIARPGRLTWIAATPAGTRVGLQTRTGNSEQPDSTWSRWSPAYAKPGQTVTSPPGRYLQYRAVLESEKPGALPAVSEVAVVYLPRNQAPTLTVSAPKTGDAWSRKQTIRWAGSDPDKDALIYNVLYSRDDGATWVKLSRVVKEKGKSGPPAAADGKPAPTPPDAGEAPEEGADAPKPPADGAAPPPAPEPAGAGRQPAAAAPAPLPAAPEGGAPAAAPGAGKPDEGKKAPEVKERKTDSFKETSYAWNTTEVPDGRYLIKVVASDRAGNPADAHTVEKIVGPILISNAAPKLSLAGDPAVAADRSVALAGDAGAGIPLAGVDYRVDEGEWISAAAADGIFDGETERFEIRTQALEAGEHSLEVRAVDAAGNHAEQTRKVVVR
ncbi:MAG: hypothetical protein HY321_03290, partial [Armatimonadetes bacterium]|nr:hypothetical protein [Armatimonadota bacterium]